MKAAFILSGQPRFTPDIIDIFNRVQNVDKADIYAVFWKSEWANTADEAKDRLEKILPANWTLAKVEVVEDPEFILPQGTINLPPPEPENIAWWYKRNWSQFHGIKMAFDLIPPDIYDVVVRIRGDCSPSNVIDFKSLDLKDDNVIVASNTLGWPDYPFNDQFFLGNYKTMKKFWSNIDNFQELVKLSDPKWFKNPHGPWKGEWLNGTFLRISGMTCSKGPFSVRMNTYGRSKFTDKHYHHGIAPDPTEK